MIRTQLNMYELVVCVCVCATGERMTACILVALAQRTMTTTTATRAMTYICNTQNIEIKIKKFAKKKPNKQTNNTDSELSTIK